MKQFSKRFRKLVCMILVGCMMIGVCITVNAAAGHEHKYYVTGKTLYNVRTGPSHSYQSGKTVDPITGVETPVYSTCYTSYWQYRGTWTCKISVNGVECGATLPGFYYFDPDEEHHSACGK